MRQLHSNLAVVVGNFNNANMYRVFGTHTIGA
jgi:hypothetical protein